MGVCRSRYECTWKLCWKGPYACAGYGAVNTAGITNRGKYPGQIISQQANSSLLFDVANQRSSKRPASPAYIIRLERYRPSADRYLINRYDMHSLEYNYTDSRNTTHRTRPRSLRRRVVARFDRYLHLCRGRWLSPGIRSSLARALHDPVRDYFGQAACGGGCSGFAFDQERVCGAVEDRVQPQRCELHGDVSPGLGGCADARYAESGAACCRVARTPGRG